MVSRERLVIAGMALLLTGSRVPYVAVHRIGRVGVAPNGCGGTSADQSRHPELTTEGRTIHVPPAAICRRRSTRQRAATVSSSIRGRPMKAVPAEGEGRRPVDRDHLFGRAAQARASHPAVGRRADAEAGVRGSLSSSSRSRRASLSTRRPRDHVKGGLVRDHDRPAGDG